MMLLFALFLGASLGHDFNQWGYIAWFDSSKISIEPNISCLSLRNSWGQGSGNLVLFDGCRDNIKINEKNLSYCNKDRCAYWNEIKYKNGLFIIEINNQTFSTSAEEDYVFKIPAEYNHTISMIVIPLEIVDGTLKNILGLLLIFSPALLFLATFFFYLLHQKPSLKSMVNLRKILLCVVIGILCFFLLLASPLLLPAGVVGRLTDSFFLISVFVVAPLLLMVLPFLLVCLLTTHIIIFIEERKSRLKRV